MRIFFSTVWPGVSISMVAGQPLFLFPLNVGEKLLSKAVFCLWYILLINSSWVKWHKNLIYSSMVNNMLHSGLHFKGWTESWLGGVGFMCSQPGSWAWCTAHQWIERKWQESSGQYRLLLTIFTCGARRDDSIGVKLRAWDWKSVTDSHCDLGQDSVPLCASVSPLAKRRHYCPLKIGSEIYR